MTCQVHVVLLHSLLVDTCALLVSLDHVLMFSDGLPPLLDQLVEVGVLHGQGPLLQVELELGHHHLEQMAVGGAVVSPGLLSGLQFPETPGFWTPVDLILAGVWSQDSTQLLSQMSVGKMTE